MNRNPFHSRKYRDNRSVLLVSKILFALALCILLGLAQSVAAYEWVNKGLEKENRMDVPLTGTVTPFSSDQLQRKGYIFGIKMDFEVNTIWSKSKNKPKSERLINNFIDENYFSRGSDFSNELPLDEEMFTGAKPAKLFEIRF